ncbi:thermonuclease family protein [Paragemmobacter ruber]|uniref:TNase-like domain-containing protein n=1 Tax=Paragemmobacter ruber TaxID=1985673 RepID=A0ABW9Y3Z5_9RHOB|nr:thermonuclease family protein [Rhodobacter ruber]NBE06851.1 hypothetical protein [Rhodobacter ruber]
MRLFRSLFRSLFAPQHPKTLTTPEVEILPRFRPLEQASRAPFSPAASVSPIARSVPPPPAPYAEQRVIRGRCWVVDGDTIVIDKIHIRLSGIDAPELDHPLGQRAKWALHALCKGQVITAIADGSVSHERTVAICRLPDGRDLAEEMVKAGLALDWPKYSGGRYRHLETEDARRKLWRANARQKGRMVVDRGGD